MSPQRLPDAIEQAVRHMTVDKGRSYHEGPEGTVILWDLDLAAFLLSRNVEIVDVFRDGSDFRIVFRADAAKVKALHLAYLSSPEGRFAVVLKLLKKAAHSIGDRPSR